MNIDNGPRGPKRVADQLYMYRALFLKQWFLLDLYFQGRVKNYTVLRSYNMNKYVNEYICILS
jgi:hypothetical protein